MPKRLAITIMALLMLQGFVHLASAQSPVPVGRAALLVDGLTGQVLLDHNGLAKNFPASTTKLLTALVAVEHGSLDQMITVSANAVSQPPDSSSCYLSPGEEQRLEYLLYGLLLASGNDCAMAIAEGVSHGNPKLFMDWMNETAQQLGATHSHFTNPHGLHHTEHYTTARDLARIARAALSNSIILRIAGEKAFDWPGKSNGTYYNHNALLFTYEGTVGGKTGFTEEAMFTLVSAARREGRLLIGIVMGNDSRTSQYEDMRALLDYGFATFEHRVAITSGSPQGTIRVDGGEAEIVPVAARHSVVISVRKGLAPDLSIERKLVHSLPAPVVTGQQVGELEVREDGNLIAVVPVTAQASVPAKPPVLQTIGKWSLRGAKWIGSFFGTLLVFRIVVKSIRRLLRRSRRRRVLSRTRTYSD